MCDTYVGVPHLPWLSWESGFDSQNQTRGPAWTAKITAEGTRLLKEQARRVEAERERERREAEARAEREREAQRLRARSLELLDAVTTAGGRLALKVDCSEREVTQITDFLAKENLLPDGQRLAHEPTPYGPRPRRDRLP